MISNYRKNFHKLDSFMNIFNSLYQKKDKFHSMRKDKYKNYQIAIIYFLYKLYNSIMILCTKDIWIRIICKYFKNLKILRLLNKKCSLQLIIRMFDNFKSRLNIIQILNHRINLKHIRIYIQSFKFYLLYTYYT